MQATDTPPREFQTSEHRSTGVATDPGFFETPELKQRLDLLHHLVQSSNLLLLVQGPEGSGKSTLLHRFASQAGEGWELCQLQGAPDLGATQLLILLMKRYGITSTAIDTDTLHAALKVQLSEQHREHQLPVVLVDDAHLLPAPALESLAQLHAAVDSPDPADCLLRIVLFGEPGFESSAGFAKHREKSGQPPHVVRIPPLDQEQTARYLQGHLESEGTPGNPATALDPAQIAAIWEQSGGIPGKINRLGREIPPRKPEESTTRKVAVGKGPGAGLQARASLTVALILVLVLVLVFQDELGNLVRAPAPENVAEPSIYQPAAPIIGQPASPPATKPVEAVVLEQLPPVINAPVANLDAAATANPAPAKSPAVPVIVESVAPDRPAMEATGTSLRNAGWLKKQPGESYVIQLAAFSRQTSIHQFVQANHLGGPLAWYKRGAPENSLFVLLAGPFPDAATARAALRDLPPRVRKARPWVRRLSAIQTTMDSNP